MSGTSTTADPAPAAARTDTSQLSRTSTTAKPLTRRTALDSALLSAYPPDPDKRRFNIAINSDSICVIETGTKTISERLNVSSALNSESKEVASAAAKNVWAVLKRGGVNTAGIERLKLTEDAELALEFIENAPKLQNPRYWYG